MAKVKLVKRGKPGPAGGPKKWYGLSVSNGSLSVRQMARQATRNTSLSPMEMEAALDLFGDYAAAQLLQGHAVKLGYLGHLRLTFKSEGVEDVCDYHPARHVREPRILFTPSKELRDRVVKNLTFELGSVVDEGVTYSSVADYLKAKGQAKAPATE